MKRTASEANLENNPNNKRFKFSNNLDVNTKYIKNFIHRRFDEEKYIIKTDDLYCRPLNESDKDLIIEIYSDPNCRALLVGREDLNEREITEWIGRRIKNYNDSGLSFYVVCKNEEKLGIAGLGLDEDHETKQPYVSIHYAFPVRSHNKGYCKKTCQELLKFALKDLQIDCIHAQTLSYNKISQLILRNLGFEPNGIKICIDNYKDEYVTKFLLSSESYEQDLTKEKFTIESNLHDDSRYFRKLINKDYKDWYNNRENSKLNNIHYKRIKNYVNLVSSTENSKRLY